MKCAISTALAVSLLVLSSGSAAQALAAADPTVARPALERLPAKGGAKLTVTTPAFKAGGDIPFENTQYRGDIFPGLAWTKGPTGTKAYAVIMQDVDVIRPTGPLVHWTMFNIPPGVTRLDPGLPAVPAGSSYGPNMRGAAQAYLGPHPPPGPKHHYHLQVFALDTVVADPGASYDALTGAMRGHVLASGEVVGLGQVDLAVPPHPAPPAPK
jgi:para-nitrobenzyl esterase